METVSEVLVTSLPNTSILKMMMKEAMTFDSDKKHIAIAILELNNYSVSSILNLELKDIDYKIVNSIKAVYNGTIDTRNLHTGSNYHYVLTGIKDFLELTVEINDWLGEEEVYLTIPEVTDKPTVNFNVRESDKKYFSMLDLNTDGVVLIFVMMRYRHNISLSKIYKLLEDLTWISNVTDVYKKIVDSELLSFNYALERHECNLEMDCLKIETSDIRVMKQINKMMEITDATN